MTSGVYNRTKKGNQNMSKARYGEWAKISEEKRLERMLPVIKASLTLEVRQKQGQTRKRRWAKKTKEEKRKRKELLSEARYKDWGRLNKKERRERTRHWSKAGAKATQTLEARQNSSRSQKKRWIDISKEERLEFMKSAIEANQKRWNRMTEEEKLSHMLPIIRASQKANPSSIEKMIWKELNKLDIEYRIQVPLNNGKFIADIYVPTQRLIIECNGDYWHNLFERKERDRKLRKYARNNGYKLIELSESEIRKNPEKALKEAYEWILFNTPGALRF